MRSSLVGAILILAAKRLATKAESCMTPRAVTKATSNGIDLSGENLEVEQALESESTYSKLKNCREA
jgi:hypothetical protein